MKNNFRLLVVTLGILIVTPAIAQKDNVGIGTAKPDQSAILDLSSTSKGFLLPRMTETQRLKIEKPAEGLKVYQTDGSKGEYTFNGINWAYSVADDPNNWSKTGNASTNPTTNFIGTTDNQPLSFRINSAMAGIIPTGTGNKSIFLGFESGLANSTGAHNVGYGTRTLATNSTGAYNVAVGSYALELNTGDENSAIGYQALGGNTTGSFNMAIGSGALQSNTSGSRNMAFGANAANKIVGLTNDVIAIGSNSLRYGTGGSNVAIGTNAGRGPGIGANTGAENVIIGKDAGISNTTGSTNTYIGAEAGYTNATGSGNVFLGYRAGTNETDPSNKLFISNAATSLPLVYGDFSAKFISIGDVGVAGDAAATLVKRNNLAAQYGLLVQKGILTEKIKVATMTSTDWADYVFDKDYKRMSLEDIEAFVKENKHLPNVPTTAEMMLSGSDLIKTDAKLLEKIEELTLYMIEMNKEIKALRAENLKLKK